MHLVLFSIVAICIAAIHAQVPVLPPAAVVAIDASSTASSTTAKAGVNKAKAAGVSTSTAAGTSTAKEESSESGEDKEKSYDHEHETHHDHEATVSIDVHNILDLFKNELHEMEERIIAAVHHEHEHGNSTAAAVVPKSYRTASR